MNDPGGCEEGEARDQDGVTGTDAERAQGKQERIGAAGEADGVLHAAVGRGCVLELLHMRAEDELAGLEDFANGGVDLGADRPILTDKIQDRDDCWVRLGSLGSLGSLG